MLAATAEVGELPPKSLGPLGPLSPFPRAIPLSPRHFALVIPVAVASLSIPPAKNRDVEPSSIRFYARSHDRAFFFIRRSGAILGWVVLVLLLVLVIVIVGARSGARAFPFLHPGAHDFARSSEMVLEVAPATPDARPPLSLLPARAPSCGARKTVRETSGTTGFRGTL